MHQKFCKVGLTLGSVDSYLLLIYLYFYSEVFITEPFIMSSILKTIVLFDLCPTSFYNLPLMEYEERHKKLDELKSSVNTYLDD